MDELIVVIIRLLLPLSIFYFPLLGAFIAIIADYYDVELLQVLGTNNLNNYQYIDKTLDIYYLSLEVFVVIFWKNRLAKLVAFSLFVFRLIGFFIFLSTGNPLFLVIFPNVFEFFYLFYLFYIKVFKQDPVTSFKRLIIILLVLSFFKIIHEYLLHINATQPWTENKYVEPLMEVIKSVS